jgi:hypothetical protein
MTKASRLLCWLLALVMLWVCAASHAQSAPEKSPIDSKVEACTQDAPMLVFSARLAKQSLANSSLAGALFESGWDIAQVHLKEISGCAELAGKMIAARQPMPPGLVDIQREYAELLFLLNAFDSHLPTDLDSKRFPACKKVLDSGIIDRAWNFINASNPSTVKIGDVMPYLSATHDLILCSTEAKKHGMPGASGGLLLLVAAIYDIESIADTNSVAQLLNTVRSTAPGQPARIQIQVLPPPPSARRVSPPQSCSGTVYGEGPVKTISWECF